MQRGGVRVAKSVIAVAGSRLFSGVAAAREPAGAVLTSHVVGDAKGVAHVRSAVSLLRIPAVGGLRHQSTVALGGEKEAQSEKRVEGSPSPASGGGKDEKQIVSYWDVPMQKLTKEDGSEWKWSCFRVRSSFNSFLLSLLLSYLSPSFRLNCGFWFCFLCNGSHGRLTKQICQ